MNMNVAKADYDKEVAEAQANYDKAKAEAKAVLYHAKAHCKMFQDDKVRKQLLKRAKLVYNIEMQYAHENFVKIFNAARALYDKRQRYSK